jgi:hypothetical protein
MAIDPSKIPSGLSWGTRGFRIGKSVSGNWWISLGLPFGFRHTWLLGRRQQRLRQPANHQEEVINPDTVEALPQTNSSISAKTENQKLLEKIRARQ